MSCFTLEKKKIIEMVSLPAFPSANGHFICMPRRHKPDAESNIPLEYKGFSECGLLQTCFSQEVYGQSPSVCLVLSQPI